MVDGAGRHITIKGFRVESNRKLSGDMNEVYKIINNNCQGKNRLTQQTPDY